MDATPFACPKCKYLFPTGDSVRNTGAPCPRCGAEVITFVFPALFRSPEIAAAGERITQNDEATCFYHTERKAELACEQCGRFVCKTCDLEIFNRHICPRCLETSKSKSKIEELETERVRWDSIALSLGVWPLLLFPCFWWANYITAPIAIFISIRHRNDRTGMVNNGNWRFTVAIISAIISLFIAIGFTTALIGPIFILH